MVEARGKKDLLTLLAGDPDFETPKHIRDTAIKAIEEGWSHYPPERGIPEFREALVNYHSRYGTDWNPVNEVIATAGSSLALYMTFVGSLNRGDEILLFEPYYVGYTRLMDYLDLKVVSVHLKEEKRYHFDVEELFQKVTPKTRAIILCSPNNPTGTVFNKYELSKISEVAKENDLLVISDEIYDQFIYDPGMKHLSIAALPGMRERTIVIMSFSKTFAMAGWRLGSIMADESIISLFRRIPTWSRPATFIQKAGVAALTGPWGPIKEFKREYQRRRDHFVKRLNEIEKIRCISPEGAFYVFPNFEATGKKSVEFCGGLIEEQKLMTTPGIAFGDTGEYHMRMPLVKPIEYLDQCATAIEDYVTSSPD